MSQHFYYVAFATSIRGQSSFRSTSLSWEREIDSAQEAERVGEFIRRDSRLDGPVLVLSWQPIKPFDPLPPAGAPAPDATSEGSGS
jgi:hypothetical protein